MRIALVVEDDPVLVEIEIGVIQSAGFLTEVVDSGELAQERMQSVDYDVVILNQSLAGKMTGTDVFKWLRGVRTNLPTVIMVTGKLNQDRPASQRSALAKVIHKGPCLEMVEKALAARASLN